MFRRRIWKRFHYSESAQVIILVALALPMLCGMIGLSIDAGMMFLVRRQMQTAADSAALAGARELPYISAGSDGSLTVTSAAQADALTNGFSSSAVTVNNPPKHGNYTSNNDAVEVIVSQSTNTIFLRVLGINSVTVAARSVAEWGVSSSNCMIVTGTSSTAVDLTGNGNLTLSASCGLTDDGGMELKGNGSLSAGSIGVAGTLTEKGNGSASPAPVTGIPPAVDPLSFLPAPSGAGSTCNAANNVSLSSNNSQSISAGVYCSISVSGNGSLSLGSGTYIIQGGGLTISGNGGISGSNVTFYVEDGGTVNFGGNGGLSVTAPTSGTYAGILVYQVAADTNDISLAGNGSVGLVGAFYAPGASIALAGNGSFTVDAELVAQQVRLTGNGAVTVSAPSAGGGVNALQTAVIVE